MHIFNFMVKLHSPATVVMTTLTSLSLWYILKAMLLVICYQQRACANQLHSCSDAGVVICEL